jgi:hypothetical protein
MKGEENGCPGKSMRAVGGLTQGNLVLSWLNGCPVRRPFESESRLYTSQWRGPATERGNNWRCKQD